MYSKKRTYKRRSVTRKNKSIHKRHGGSRNRSKRVRRSRRQRRMRGGSNMWPLVGSPYNATSAHPDGNYLAYNQRVEARPQQSNMVAGGGKGRKKLRGGGLGTFINTIIPSDLLTLGRTIPAAATHAYDRYTGVLSSPSSMPYPTQQPLIAPVSTSTMMNPPDMLKMYNNNNNLVSKI